MRNSRYIGTYRGTLPALAAAAGTAPFFVLSGAADKQIILRGIRISGATLTAVAYLNLVLTKYSTAPTGGTASALTAVPIRSDEPASSAAIKQGYTAAPTAGTAVGDICGIRLLGQATTAAAAGVPAVSMIEFGLDDAPVLLNAAENVGVRFSTAPATAVTLTLDVEWDEYSNQ